MPRQPEIGPQRIRAAAVADTKGLGLIVFDFGPYLAGRRGAVTRMIAGIATPVGELADIARDTFSRNVANSWGNADTGQTWDPSVVGMDVNGSEGTIAIAGAQTPHLALSLTDCTILAHFPNLAGPAAARSGGLVGRWVDASNYVYCWHSDNPAADTIGVTRRVAGVETDFTGSKAGLPTDINVRLTFDGAAASAKFWDSAASEPVANDLSIGGAAVVAGGCGVYVNSGLGSQQRVDTFTVSSATPAAPTWDAYIGDVSNPGNLIDSSQGIALPRWVPSLVNGQPVSQGDILTIVAQGGSPGADLVASCYLVTQPV